MFSLQVASLLYVHGFIMKNPLFKAIFKFRTSNSLRIIKPPLKKDERKIVCIILTGT